MPQSSKELQQVSKSLGVYDEMYILGIQTVLADYVTRLANAIDYGFRTTTDK